MIKLLPFTGVGMKSSVLVLCVATAIGCSGNTGQPELTPVTGAVLLDGQPLSDASLTFYLSGSPVPGYTASLGKTDETGKYELISGGKPGAVPGVFKVTISRIVNTSGAPVNAGEGMDLQQLAMRGLAKESLPEKYSNLERTELTLTVEKGKTEGYDFNLKSS